MLFKERTAPPKPLAHLIWSCQQASKAVSRTQVYKRGGGKCRFFAIFMLLLSNFLPLLPTKFFCSSFIIIPYCTLALLSPERLLHLLNSLLFPLCLSLSLTHAHFAPCAAGFHFTLITGHLLGLPFTAFPQALNVSKIVHHES